MIGSFGHLMPQKSARVSLVKLTGSDPKIFSRVRFLLENSIQKRRSPLPRLPTFHHGKWFCVLTEYGYSVSAESGGFGAAVLSACLVLSWDSRSPVARWPVSPWILLETIDLKWFLWERKYIYFVCNSKKMVGPKIFLSKNCTLLKILGLLPVSFTNDTLADFWSIRHPRDPIMMMTNLFEDHQPTQHFYLTPWIRSAL